MERLGDIVARVLANVRVTMDGKGKAGGAVETPPEGAARRDGRITARMGKEWATGQVATKGRDISSPAARRPTVEIYEHALDHGSK